MALIPKNIKNVSLEKLYKIYLEKVNLDESKMPNIQKKETKQAYMAACTQMLLCFFEITNVSESDGIEIFERLHNEANQYWETGLRDDVLNTLFN